ncbi:hypothetical protein [Klebsiella pneumoniae]|uniref:hypothetical protein n=1 Tax=Klebsiella pneumoniae TaxID=573 RepID=UPI000E2D4A78|nr:hypothetical protein [Klebsiella pneumoniae]SVZ53997.1 Uncharacterised protein [Klebsiella pneumoniae]HBS6028372.1 hypothetical protein [Klebsiella pneumoniae]HBS6120680.1 hypothetical protein [Klebsiella pneumoniae]
MTDITELALREKFEAWWEREYKHLESSKYTDAVPHIKYGFWMAYQAGGAELVEALEKAQQRNGELETYSKTALEFREAARDENRHLKLELEIAENRIAELESLTVTVKLPNQTQFDDPLSAYEAIEKCKEALTAQGIKWEAE